IWGWPELTPLSMIAIRTSRAIVYSNSQGTLGLVDNGAAKETTMTNVAGLSLLAAVFAVMPVQAQAPAVQRAAEPAIEEKPEEGIPVTDPLVISKCGTCHTKDDKGNLSRISWERATPEGWEEAIKRMVRLNGLNITPVEARSVLKYLSTYHGLAPE